MVKDLSPKEIDLCSDAVDSYACLCLRRASRAVTQCCDEILKPTGMRCTQLVILLTIPLLKNPSIVELAAALLMDRSTLTRNLRPLQKNNLVKIEEGEDRRKKVIRLTKKGRNKVKIGLPVCEKYHKKLVKKIGAKRWGEVMQCLDEIVEAIQHF